MRGRARAHRKAAADLLHVGRIGDDTDYSPKRTGAVDLLGSAASLVATQPVGERAVEGAEEAGRAEEAEGLASLARHRALVLGLPADVAERGEPVAARRRDEPAQLEPVVLALGHTAAAGLIVGAVDR